MDYQARYRKINDKDYQAYYDALAAAQGRDPQATARTRDADGTIPGEAREKLFNISAEIKNTFHELGSPMPPLLEGCTVADLCCGSGRDTYLAAQLVGETGKVIGVEPNARRLAIAEKYHKQEIVQFGYAQSNVELVNGCPEDLSFIPDGSVDVVISNCTFNLSPDKGAYLREVFRVLKEGGEFYFTDVFADRRMPADITDDITRVAQRLGGALYLGDFRRLAQEAGFADPRYLQVFQAPLSSAEKKAYADVAFATITARLMKSASAESECENFNFIVTYDGGLPDYPEAFVFDKDITLETGTPRTACSNIIACVGAPSRYAAVFNIEGSNDVHTGSAVVHNVIGRARDFEGVVDEDDQPIQASCC